MIKNEKLLAEIRKRPCSRCGSGNWNSDRGEFCNHSHHVKRKGLGGGFREDTEENVISLCWKCHQIEHSTIHWKTKFD